MANRAEKEMQQFLMDFFQACQGAHEGVNDALEEALEADFPAVADFSTYEDHGVLSNNAGIMVALENGSKFYITIVQG